MKLVRYALDNSDKPIRPFANVPVTLTLRDSKGKTAERVAMYQIALKPTLAVLRSD